MREAPHKQCSQPFGGDTSMDKPEKERRNMSLGGLLDSAISAINQLTNSSDMTTRTLASRALNDIQRARRQVPMRRKMDITSKVR